MKLKLSNIITTQQLCSLLGFREGAIRYALENEQLTEVRPFPHNIGSGELTGPRFILCDNKLAGYLERSVETSRARKEDKFYDPVIEAGKYVKWVV